VLVVAVIGASYLGFSVTDFFNDVKKTVDEQTKIANTQGDPDVTTTGNFVEDTGTRSCNLKVEFVGTITGDLLTDSPNVFNGKYLQDGILEIPNVGRINKITHDDSVINYQWYCQGEASLLDMLAFSFADNARNLEMQNLFQIDNNQKLRFYFSGESETNQGKKLTGCLKDENCADSKKINEFIGSIDISAGTQLPSGFNVPVYLYDVAEDDYKIAYKSDNLKINDRPVNTVFYYDLMKP
jgi:hypothetical protein